MHSKWGEIGTQRISSKREKLTTIKVRDSRKVNEFILWKLSLNKNELEQIFHKIRRELDTIFDFRFAVDRSRLVTCGALRSAT